MADDAYWPRSHSLWWPVGILLVGRFWPYLNSILLQLDEIDTRGTLGHPLQHTWTIFTVGWFWAPLSAIPFFNFFQFVIFGLYFTLNTCRDPLSPNMKYLDLFGPNWVPLVAVFFFQNLFSLDFSTIYVLYFLNSMKWRHNKGWPGPKWVTTRGLGRSESWDSLVFFFSFFVFHVFMHWDFYQNASFVFNAIFRDCPD